MQQKVLNDRYELERKIGEGGMARIYAGRDLRLSRRVAIKIPHSHFVNDPDFIERFRHEAQAAAMLSHPNIVDVYDVGKDGEISYIVMEFVEGTDLKSRINREAPLPVEQGVAIAEQIARGLTPPTGPAWSTATSSPRTSSSPPMARRASRTLAWPRATSPPRSRRRASPSAP